MSGSKLTINLSALADNYNILKSRGTGAECAAVVKANGYGLGAVKVVERLKQAGCNKFFVAHMDEGLEISPLLKSYILHGVTEGQEETFLKYNLTPVLNTVAQIQLWNKFALSKNIKLPAIIHVDTGMNRLGISYNEAVRIAEDKLEGIELEYIMSHLACSGTVDHDMNLEQLKRFNEARKLFPNTKATLANSSAVLLKTCYHFDLLRPGCSLYGIHSIDGQRGVMKTVATITSKPMQIRRIDTPQAVGYGAAQVVSAGTIIATVPVGYADGYLRSLSHVGYGFADGLRLPIVGRVSMDMVLLDVTAIGEQRLADLEIEMLGDNVLVDDVAEAAGTIGYEILTRLGTRFERVYKD
jgi:alanine racemase